ncbi:hypothetical protein E3N88_26572 [Mikania micrantha]|uniref:Uncharacterized protein n=1 Tax=Mikania micrantha TaxID=192012 RepID=A0A5N6MUW1_9ASTR|nr:hypothetical protein E3N88_26572 [Mikania micrantha]
MDCFDLLLPFPHAATPLPATPYPPPPSASLPMEAVPIPATLTPAVSDCSSSGNSLRWLLFLLCGPKSAQEFHEDSRALIIEPYTTDYIWL